MKLQTLLMAIGSTLLSQLAQAESAGRILSLSGEASLVRAGKSIKLSTGSEVENGDRILVGEKSSLQIRFTDESVVALRPNSEFRIEDYKFNRNPETDRGAFNLVKGGLRTITGAIGKGKPENYGVRTSTATIGIRGTHYVLVSCNNDCTNGDGSQAPNGLFGGVTDGRISVSNEAGSTDFGQQEYFRVADQNALPERLLVPPGFLTSVSFSQRNRSGSGSAQASTSVTAQDSGNSQQISTSPTPSQFSTPQPTLTPATTNYSVNTQPASTSTLSDTISTASSSPGLISGSSTGTGTGVISMAQASGSPGFTNVESFTMTAAEFAALGYPNATSPSALAAAVQSQGFSVSYSAAANAYWTYEVPSATDGPNHFGWHYAWGDPVTNMPTSGIATYAFVGATNPTDTMGRTGSFTGSNLTVNFTSQQITNLSAMQMNFASTQTAPTTTIVFPANQTWAIGSNTYQPMASTCLAGCTAGSQTYAYTNGQFVGSGASGLTAAIAVNATVNNQQYAAGNVAVFAKQ